MQGVDGELVYSASDLVGFSACDHLVHLELAVIRGELARPSGFDPLLAVLARRGEAHEAGVLEAFTRVSHRIANRASDVATPDGRSVVRVPDEGGSAAVHLAVQETLRAMRDGAGLIYQAAFLHDGWFGRADFLWRVDAPSDLGSWSYEVGDAKLARTVRASAIVQLCEYAQHVSRIQGTEPREIHVITGDEVRHTFRLADYAAYHRMLKRRFLERVGNPDGRTYPEPIEHCGICRWWEVCRLQRRADDHLSLVAGIRTDQVRRLNDAGVTTRTALAQARPEDTPPRLAADTFETLRLQAALQVQGEGCTPPLHELIDAAARTEESSPARGLAALPTPSAGDIYLDLEGDPYALDTGLDYLFGLVEISEDKTVYHPFWAHTRNEERAAFRRAVELITARRRQHPDMHVYHYAPYEPSAFRRLMGAHGVCEDEVDDLLRGEVFVDLYRVVKQAVRLSTESYSLKDVEKLYFERPAGAVMSAGSSVITYERYLAEGDAQLLGEIEAYNADDCTSLVGLHRWLEKLRADTEEMNGPIPRPQVPEAVEVADTEPDANAALSARLLDGVDDEPLSRSADEHGRYLLAHLIEWHRREAKPAWWKFFERRDHYEPDDFVEDTECIGKLVSAGEVGHVRRSTVFGFGFEPQDHKFVAGDSVTDPGTGGSAGTIERIDDDGLVLRRASARDAHPLPEALMPGKPISTSKQRAAIFEIAEWVADNGIGADGPYRAVRDLLLRNPPRRRSSGPLRMAEESVLEAAERIVVELDQGSLAIQGPPGAGKTYTGARMIVAAVRAGLQVGITATTHSAITNLLDEVVSAAAQTGQPVRGMQKADGSKGSSAGSMRLTEDNGDIDAALRARDIDVAAGTAWLWSRTELRQSVDVLFVDEAGQMSLADVTAVGTAARNLVLLGDPQQLGQPSQGTHPEGAGASALQHLLDDHATMPEDLGLFLDTTYRLHPEICGYISDIAYEGRLDSAPGCRLQQVDDDAGVWYVPVSHVGDRVRSRDEAVAVAQLIGELVGRKWIDSKGEERDLTLDDLIVIAPYNAHVAELRRALGDGARVGTVDKFQGREGAVAVYSTGTSSAEEAPRGIGFLYDLHRINVAVSRAKARAYVVASPDLLHAHCKTPEQIRLVNALCAYVERSRAKRDAPLG